MGKWGQSSLLTLGPAVVIRCLLRPSDELRRAMETLNRYIDGGRKRDQTTDLRGIEDSDAEYGLVAQNQGPAFASVSAYAALWRDLPSSDFGMVSILGGARRNFEVFFLFQGSVVQVL